MFAHSIKTNSVTTLKALMDFLTDLLRSTELLEMNPATSTAMKQKPEAPSHSSRSPRSTPAHAVYRSRTLITEKRSAVSRSNENQHCVFGKSDYHNIFTCTDFLMTGISAYPVSYTHLDVYKRQHKRRSDMRLYLSSILNDRKSVQEKIL